MKFDLFKWNEAKPNEKTNVEKGWLRVRSSVPAPLYVESEGVEVLVSYGTTWDIQVGTAVAFHVDGPKTARVFYEVNRAFSEVHHGEVFTNIDRMADESGSLLEVRRALRELKLAERAALENIRANTPRQAVRDLETVVETVAEDTEAQL